MELIIEDKFKSGLYKKYNVLKKLLIPKSEYYLIVDELKRISSQQSTKPNKEYCLLYKYEILQCGDVEKLIRGRQSHDEQILYFV